MFATAISLGKQRTKQKKKRTGTRREAREKRRPEKEFTYVPFVVGKHCKRRWGMGKERHLTSEGPGGEGGGQ